MVSLMTYNIGADSKKHITSIIDVIKNEAPDLLVLNEATWLGNNLQDIQNLSIELGLPYFHLARSKNSYNHTVIYSKFRLKNSVVFPDFQNAGMMTVAEMDLGDISIAGIHLASNTEDTRIEEITDVISQQQDYRYKLIMGDLNSISSENIVRNQDLSVEPARYDVINYIKNAGYFDTAVITKKEQTATVPVTQDNGITYIDLRLDYIFMSNSLLKRFVDYHVIINEVTGACSDHYPVVVGID